MLDIRLIRSDTDGVRAALARRQADGLLDEVLALDERRRALQTEVDELRAERNTAAQAIGEAKRAGRDAAAEIAAAADLRDRLAARETALRELDAEFETAMLALPNLPARERGRRHARGGRARCTPSRAGRSPSSTSSRATTSTSPAR